MCGCSDMAMSIPKKTWKSRQQQTLYGIMTLRSHHISLTKSRRMIRRLTALSVVLILSVACEHKPFCWHHPHDGMLRVEFAWWDATRSRIHCEVDGLLRYPKEGGKARRFDFAGSKGGTISLPVGDYHSYASTPIRKHTLSAARSRTRHYHPYPRQLYTRRNGYKSRRRWRLLRG